MCNGVKYIGRSTRHYITDLSTFQFHKIIRMSCLGYIILHRCSVSIQRISPMRAVQVHNNAAFDPALRELLILRCTFTAVTDSCLWAECYQHRGWFPSHSWQKHELERSQYVVRTCTLQPSRLACSQNKSIILQFRTQLNYSQCALSHVAGHCQ
jgi:hypothetical protein